MNVGWESTWPGALVRSALLALVVMILLRLALRLLKIRSAHAYRIAAVLVVLQGWIVAPLVLSIPWYAPPEPAASTTVSAFEPLDSPFDLPSGSSTLGPSAEFAGVGASSASSGTGAESGRPSEGAFGAMRWAAAIWLAGVVAGAAALALSYWRCVRQARSAPVVRLAFHPDGRPADGASERATVLPVRFTKSTGPMLCLLPTGYEFWAPADFWSRCSADERAAVLRHELSHQRRGDIWKSWLVYLLALPQWFNPAVWWATSVFRQAGEWLSDEAAADTPERRAEYLRALLRLAELQPPYTSAAGHCAHAHPLLVRVRRLTTLPSVQDAPMKRLLFRTAVVALAVAGLVRVDLVAREAAPPASIDAVKQRVEALDERLTALKSSVEALKPRAVELKDKVGPVAERLKTLAKDPAALSADLKRRVELFESGEEPKQLEALADLDKLASRDEAVLAAGHAAKNSPHEAVRRKALASLAAFGEDGYAGLSLCYDSLDGKDRAFIAAELNKQTSDDKLILLIKMTEGADDELFQALFQLKMEPRHKLTFLAAVAEARKGDRFVAQVVELGESLPGDDGLVLLYAVAKGGEPKQVVAAVSSALKRQEAAFPVLAAAYQRADAEVRTAVVKGAKQLGGETADYLVKSALEDADPNLRAAAEAAVK